MKPEDQVAFEDTWKAHEEYVGSKILSNKAQGFDIWGRALAHRDAQAFAPINEQLIQRLKQGRNLLGPDNLAGWDGDEREYELAKALDQLIATAESPKGVFDV